MRRGSLLVLGVVLSACTTAVPPTPTPTPTQTAGPTATATPAQPSVAPTATPTPVATATPPPAFAELPGAIDSAGCTLLTGAAGDSSIEIDVDGVARTALLHVPERLADGKSVPLVLALHGSFMDGQATADLTGFSALADERGFLVAYPDPNGEFFGWNANESSDLPDDMGFLTALIDQLEATYCVDTAREFATGFSAGGTMAHTAACRDPRIAAISMVSSGFVVGEPICEPESSLPTVVIQGLLDPLVPYLGGRIPLPEFPDAPPSRPVPEWIAEVAAQNGCDEESLERGQIGDWVVPFDWQHCDAPLTLYRVGNGGHNWPGGTGLEIFGNINQDISASEVSYDFFLENARVVDPLAFEDPAGAYVVHLLPKWGRPLAGRFFIGNEDEASVTFPIDQLAMVIVSSGSIADGVPTGAGTVKGSTAQELADALQVLHADWTWYPTTMSVDGEPIVLLHGPNYFAFIASFTHGDQAFLVYLFSDVAGLIDMSPTLDTFLRRFEFTD